MKLSTHLNFPGNCAQAFDYYEQNLGGRILMMMKQSQAPGARPNPDQEDPVLHARIKIGETTLIGMMYLRIIFSRFAVRIFT